MKEKLLQLMLPHIIDALLSAFDADHLKRMLDQAIDTLEDKIEFSDSKIDDSVLPIIRMIRTVFDIPDYPDAAPASSPKKD